MEIGVRGDIVKCLCSSLQGSGEGLVTELCECGKRHKHDCSPCKLPCNRPRHCECREREGERERARAAERERESWRKRELELELQRERERDQTLVLNGKDNY